VGLQRAGYIPEVFWSMSASYAACQRAFAAAWRFCSPVRTGPDTKTEATKLGQARPKWLDVYTKAYTEATKNIPKGLWDLFWCALVPVVDPPKSCFAHNCAKQENGRRGFRESSIGERCWIQVCTTRTRRS
jgi:hypothetical protein